LTQGLDGVLSTDGVTRFVTNASENWTIVTAIDDLTGRVVRTRTLPHYYGVPIVAYDGTTAGTSGDARSLVVAGYGPFPGEPGTTRFAVLNARTLGVRSLIALFGSWSYDAISPDGRTLYLVQHVSAGPRPLYRVRSFDVRRGRLDPSPIVDRLEQESAMGGQPATRITSRDGRWAYTLYARAKGKPFVHALDTARRQAFCIDLPLRLAVGRQLLLRLELRQRRLLVADWTHRTVAGIDTRTFRVRAL
jgi:hypothetical protein